MHKGRILFSEKGALIPKSRKCQSIFSNTFRTSYFGHCAMISGWREMAPKQMAVDVVCWYNCHSDYPASSPINQKHCALINKQHTTNIFNFSKSFCAMQNSGLTSLYVTNHPARAIFNPATSQLLQGETSVH